MIDLLVSPFVLLFAPIFYYVARTGTGAEICRRMGFQPLLLHYYQPLPEYENVPLQFFDLPHHCPGFEMDKDDFSAQLQQLGVYSNECVWPETTNKPGEYYTQNYQFGYSSAVLLFTMIRANASKRVVEIGSGFSSQVSFEALCKNHAMNDIKLTCIEPYPSDWLEDFAASHPTSVHLLKMKAQDIDLNTYLSLEAGDVLFIDSSHVSKLASDVNFLYLQVLPLLDRGIIIHVHDIYIPYEYPKIHFFGKPKYFWNEQYMLQAFLSHNSAFQVLLPGYYVQKDMPDVFHTAFPAFNPQQHRLTSSFWMKKIT
jgi:hypothetical protein